MTETSVTDAEIVAFLDNALPSDQQARIAVSALEDSSVADRIDAMSIERTKITSAFDDLLNSAPQIPIEPTKNADASDSLAIEVSPSAAANTASPPSRRWQAVAAAALLAAGIGLGTQIPETAGDEWHMAVADYQLLYTTDTLTGTKLTQNQRWSSLAQTSEALGLSLQRKDVMLSGLDFRRAQLLQHKDAPLAQLAFLDANGDAIALCFTRTGGPDTKPENVQLAGLNAITWQQNGMGFILIGGKDDQALQDWQIGFSARISS